jgi:phosphatidate cytidylyltransferase
MTGTRVLTAAVLIPLVVGLVLFAPTWVVGLATAVITIMALWEYFALGNAIGHRGYRLWTAFCTLLLILEHSLGAFWRHGDAPGILSDLVLAGPLLIFFVFVLGIVALTLWGNRAQVEALPAAGITCSGFLLVAVPLSFTPLLHGGRFGPQVLMFALLVTWAADTTAYFVGRAFGKHLLAPQISPKKTWEGSIGGMIGSLLIGWAFTYWVDIPLPHALAMAAIGNVAGQLGDLVESAYKRSAGVKDSGALLPGHGGILDRIDALILCIPTIWYYLVLVNPPILLRR